MKDCEQASKDASYKAVIMDLYKAYSENGNEVGFEKKLKQYLTDQYGYDDNVEAAMLVILDSPGIPAYALNFSNGGTYQNVQFFNTRAKEKILDVAAGLDTGTTIVGVEGKIYMVRNLVTAKFVPYAVLALELDQESMMESYKGIWGYADAALYWNGELLVPGKRELEGCREHDYDYIVSALGNRDAVYQ